MITWSIKSLFATLSNSEIDALRPNGAIVVKVEWQVSGVDRNIAAAVSGFQEFVYDPATERNQWVVHGLAWLRQPFYNKNNLVFEPKPFL